MSVIFDSEAHGSFYPQTTATLSGHNLGYGSGNDRVVLAFINTVGSNADPGFTTITYNGTTMNLLGHILSTAFSTNWVTSVFYLFDTDLPSTSGSYSLQYLTSSGYDSKAAVLSYTGVNQTTPPYTSGVLNDANPAVTDVITTNITLASSSGAIVDCVNGLPSATATGTPGTNQNERVDAGDADEFLFISDKQFTSSGSNSMSWTSDQSYYCYGHTLIELAATGGTVETPSNTVFFGINF